MLRVAITRSTVILHPRLACPGPGGSRLYALLTKVGRDTEQPQSGERAKPKRSPGLESPKERPLAQVMGVGRPAGHQHQIRVDLAVMSRDKDVELVVAHSTALEWLTTRPPHKSSSLLVPAFLSFGESECLVRCRPSEPVTRGDVPAGRARNRSWSSRRCFPRLSEVIDHRIDLASPIPLEHHQGLRGRLLLDAVHSFPPIGAGEIRRFRPPLYAATRERFVEAGVKGCIPSDVTGVVS